MRIRHRIPREAVRLSDPVSPEYEAQVQLHTARGVQREREAQRRLAAAEARLAKAQQIKAKPQRAHAILVARELVELRRQELLAVQRSMQGAPASAEHRNKREHHRPVIPMRTL